MFYKSLFRPVLFRMDAEKAHDITLDYAKWADRHPSVQSLARLFLSYRSATLSQNIWGLKFPNPIGLAAGFDKNGLLPHIMEAMGFGFLEIGSVTAKPSTGNPKPRAFRLPKDYSMINRMGLNNDGAQTVAKRLKKIRSEIPLGINIAKTNNPELTGDKAIQDYRESYQEVRGVADYITLNISCPNTADGRTFEDPGALDELLSTLNIRSDARVTPTLVKFSADLERPRLERLIELCEDHAIHGYVAANTSSRREGLATNPAVLSEIGNGGLSGRAIAEPSTRLIRLIYAVTKGHKAIIGVGGIDSFESALEKLKAGADLIQLYTGLVYEGPSLVKKINKKLSRYLSSHELDSILQLEKDHG